MWFIFNEWPHFLTFRSTLQRSFVLVSRFVKESSCWGIRVVDFLIGCFFFSIWVRGRCDCRSKYSESPWLNRMWSYKCNTLKSYHQNLCAAAAMLHHKCWKMRNIIYDWVQDKLMLKVRRHHCIAHALRRIYLSNHVFFGLGRDFLSGVYWTMFKAHCLLNSSGADGFSTRICTRGII